MPSTICDELLVDEAPLQACYECLVPIACFVDFFIVMGLVLVLFITGLILLNPIIYISEKIMVVARIVILWMDILIDLASLYIPAVSVLGVSVPRTPPAQNPVLPMELQDAIIRICDKSALSSCSLVCSAWLPLCRPRMTFTVNSYHHTAGLGRLLRNSRETVSPYLRHLIISSEYKSGDLPGLPQHNRLLRLLWLKHAPLQSVIFDSSLMSVTVLSQYFPNITSLGYRFSRSRDSWGLQGVHFHNLVTFVPAFPQLRSLLFDDKGSHFSLYRREDEKTPGGPLPITSIKIRTTSPDILPMLILLEQRCTNLVSFDCCIPFVSDHRLGIAAEAVRINNILKRNRQTLLHVTLPVYVLGSPTFSYDLSHSTSLKTLHLVLHYAPAAENSAVGSLLTLDTKQIEQVIISERYDCKLSALPAIDEVLIEQFGLTRLPPLYASVTYINLSRW